MKALAFMDLRLGRNAFAFIPSLKGLLLSLAVEAIFQALLLQ